MFGRLRNRVEYLASQVAGLQWVRKLDVQERERLEKQVADLKKALEWHVGTTLEIILAEERVLKLKVAERKHLIEETGSADLVNTVNTGRGEQDGTRTKVDRA